MPTKRINPELKKAQQRVRWKRWHAKNIEKERERVRAAAQKGRDADGGAKARAAVSRYRIKNPQKVREATARWRRKNTAQLLWAQAKKRAAVQKLSFDIDVSFVQNLLDTVLSCPYVKVPFATPEPGFSKSPWKASLDRKVPRLGYTRDNTELVSVWWNTAKNEWTPAVMERAVRGIGG